MTISADVSDSLESVARARQALEAVDWIADEPFLEVLLADHRAGVRALGARVLTRRARLEAEEKRQRRMLREEERYWADGAALIAGVDEAGRGPLAGPVVAAAAVLLPGSRLLGVDDSKRLSPEKRERLFPMILSKCRAVGVGVVGRAEIDRRNIRQASFLAMRKALGHLRLSPDIVLVDGEAIPGLLFRQKGIPGGDGRSLSIAAGSVVAKVVRDRIMRVLHRRYPGYGFDRHKGYGTPAHRAAIARLGLCAIHRRTFCHEEPGLSGEPEREIAAVGSHEFGREGEQTAVRYLRDKGYRILATNYRWHRAEIDVVAEDGNHLVFVEVKSRKGHSFGSPEGAVDRRKQQQIAKVAAHYLQVHGLEDADCRFDVLALKAVPGSGVLTVDHFENAFWVERRFVL